MPAWWARKSNRNKEEQQQNHLKPQSPQGNHYGFFKSSNKNEDKKSKDKSKSFDELLTRNSPRISKDFAAVGGFSGFSGFDSDGPGKRGHPLPQPSQSLGNDHGAGLGSGSVSVSSVSSCESSEDHPNINEHAQLAVYRLGRAL